VETITTKTFFISTFLLSEIPGLVTQCRGALFQNVANVACRIRKIPGLDVTWRAFVCADTDLDPEDFSTTSLIEFVRNHPGAVPLHTLDKDTTQSCLDFSITWLNGLGSSVTTVLPPLRVPRLVVFAESTNLKDKEAVITWHGTVEISGFGYVAGNVSRASPP
jgi:hypothetical protein